MHRGYIKIWRKTIDNFIAANPDALALWVHLLLLASHKQTEFMFNGKRIVLKRGQFVTGRKKLSQLTGISESKVFRLLISFKIEQLIEQQNMHKFSLICIKNYEKYQSSEQQNERAVNSQRTASEQPVNTFNNDKNVKNVKNDKNTYSFFQNEWNESMPTKLLKLSDKRKSKLKARLIKDCDFETHFKICLQKIKDSDFLSGRSGNWKVSFDWLIDNDNNYIKVLEDNYKNNKAQSSAERTIENAREYIKGINNETTNGNSNIERGTVVSSPF